MAKKGSRLGNSVSAHLKSGLYFYLALLFMLIVGLAAGISSCKTLNNTDADLYLIKLFDHISENGYEFWSCFIRSFCINTLILGSVILCGIYTAGIITCALGVVIKGFLIGYTLQSFIYNLGSKSPLFIICALVLAWLPQVVLLLYVAGRSLREWISRTGHMLSKRKTAPVNTDYLLHIAKLSAVLAVCIILETAVYPSLNTNIFNFLNQ